MQDSIALITHLPSSCKFSFIGLEPIKANWSPGVVFKSEVYSLTAGFYFDKLMSGGTQSGLGDLLSHLELPQLTWLELHAERSGTLSWDAATFSSFIVTSPLLTTLRLFDTFLTPSQLVAALACTPHLEELAIEDVDFDSTLITTTLLTELSLVRVHAGEFEFIPALRRLYMRGTFVDVDTQVLATLLRLRAKTPSRTPSESHGFKCEISVQLDHGTDDKFNEIHEMFKENWELDVAVHLDKDFWSP
uniref:F-box domain-containing protein n=1 Tax=Mycena chlorophos TaxID=658473 RepID=A0ABQ0LJP4_MYCCL|nr:predicted protein [Mycena chlorophos]